VLSVKLVGPFLGIPDILRRFLGSPYITVTSPMWEIVVHRIVSLRVEDPVNILFVRVIHNCWLRFRWWLTGSRRCIVVEQEHVEQVVFPDRIREV
jgi:hypothetical protein